MSMTQLLTLAITKLYSYLKIIYDEFYRLLKIHLDNMISQVLYTCIVIKDFRFKVHDISNFMCVCVSIRHSYFCRSSLWKHGR